MRSAKLVIIYQNRTITIPFKDIKSIDDFTFKYQNKQELGNAIKKIFKLNVKDNSVKNAYVLYSYHKGNKKNGEIISLDLEVKYHDDDFDKSEIKEKCIDYYARNINRLNTGDIKYVKKNYEKSRNIDITMQNEHDIAYHVKNIVNTYLDNNYRRYRDMYFFLQEKGYKFKNIKLNIQEDMTFNYDENDEFLSYLETNSSKGSEEYDEFMRYLDYPNDLKKVNKESPSIDDDLRALKYLSGKSIEELMALVNNYQEEYRRSRRK